jgi:hypothetical protein
MMFSKTIWITIKSIYLIMYNSNPNKNNAMRENRKMIPLETIPGNGVGE